MILEAPHVDPDIIYVAKFKDSIRFWIITVRWRKQNYIRKQGYNVSDGIYQESGTDMHHPTIALSIILEQVPWSQFVTLLYILRSNIIIVNKQLDSFYIQCSWNNILTLEITIVDQIVCPIQYSFI